PATTQGYAHLLVWLSSFGAVTAVGVEGTGTYGAGLARSLAAHGIQVIEIDRPDRRTRRTHGKSDPIDAISAARAVLAGTATGIPKTRTGPVEALRALKVARRGAIKARSAALNQLHGLITSAPQEVRTPLEGLTIHAVTTRCARFRIDPGRITDPTHATRAALRAIARRITDLTEEITTLDHLMGPLVQDLAPRLLSLHGIGIQVAAQLLITAGDNPERLRSEAAFAHLCGAAPLPASSGRTDRHRLNRGGDRAGNNALHTIVVVRLKAHPATVAYRERRTQQGLTKKEIIRCLKRNIVREVLPALLADIEDYTSHHHRPDTTRMA
uniref:IS110 family transposase n=1 Tax=Nocardioides sp. TaxID=35761 RepID=UPI00286D53D9